MKGVQCYELFGGIALKIHTFSFFIFKSPVLLAFLLMIVPFIDQYILKVIPFLYKKIYSSCGSGQIHGKWHLMLTNVSYFVSLIASQV